MRHLVQATNGELYGTTDQGGTTTSGTIFDVTPQGSLTTLNSFCCHTIYTAGDAPSGLTETADGVLYGTTALSGLDQCQIDITQTGGCGTIFQVGLSGELTTLYNFSGPDGASPGGLMQGTDGNLYGTTSIGGANDEEPFTDGYGTIFKFTPGFGLTTLYSFCPLPGCQDGFGPGSLVQGADGNFYGVTRQRRRWSPSGGDHVRSGRNHLQNHSQGHFDHALRLLLSKIVQPTAHTQMRWCKPPTAISTGQRLEAGWTSAIRLATIAVAMGGDGIIFEMIPGSAPVILHNFDGADGATPDSALIQASDGNLYGTTACGGANGAGTIFQITPAGVFTSLYSFAGSPASRRRTQRPFAGDQRNVLWNHAQRGDKQRRHTLQSLNGTRRHSLRRFPLRAAWARPF